MFESQKCTPLCKRARARARTQLGEKTETWRHRDRQQTEMQDDRQTDRLEEKHFKNNYLLISVFIHVLVCSVFVWLSVYLFIFFMR